MFSHVKMILFDQIVKKNGSFIEGIGGASCDVSGGHRQGIEGASWGIVAIRPANDPSGVKLKPSHIA